MSYRGVAFGAAMNGAKRQAGLRSCFKYEGGILCSTDRKIADVSVHELWTFMGGKLVGVTLTFSSSDYPALREIFVEKYGPPKRAWHESVRTLMGAQDENEIQTWTGEVVSVHLWHYSNKITEGMASIETNAYSDAVSKEAAAKKRKAKDAF